MPLTPGSSRWVSATLVWCVGMLAVTGSLPAQTSPEPIPGFVDLIHAGMQEDTIPGVVAVVVTSGGIAWSEGFGVADRATGRPVDPDSTLFRIGSITKALTALGMLRLIERDALAHDTPVHQIVPLPALEAHADDPVRIGHLLSHTGGFDQTGLGRQAPSAEQRLSLWNVLDEHLVPIRAPGAVATYDTYGMSLAGLVIETASGESYADFMRNEVFEPLGMRQTFIETPPEARNRLAVGYGLESGVLIPQPYEWYTTLPASSADATAADIARLMVALLGDGSTDEGRLLRPETVRALREEPFSDGTRPFANGWWVGRAFGHPVLYHGGVMRGYSAQLVLLPDRGAGLFVAYNRDPETGPPPRLRDLLTGAFLRHMLANEPETMAVEYVEFPTADFEGWWVKTLGCFTCRDGEGWPLQVEHIESVGPGVVRFRDGRWRMIDSLTFRREGSGASLRFTRNAARQIRYVNAGQDGFERLDSALVSRVTDWMDADRKPEGLQARLAQVLAQSHRQRDIEALAARAPTVDPAGAFLFRPVGATTAEPMRVELRRTDGMFEGWFQPRADRPQRPIQRVIVGGNEVWLVVEVPGGVLDLRFVIEGSTFRGTLSEELEEIRVTGRHVPARP